MAFEDYDKAFDLDVRSVVDLTVRTLPMLIAAKGNIVNTSSTAATEASNDLDAKASDDIAGSIAMALPVLCLPSSALPLERRWKTASPSPEQ